MHPLSFSNRLGAVPSIDRLLHPAPFDRIQYRIAQFIHRNIRQPFEADAVPAVVCFPEPFLIDRR